MKLFKRLLKIAGYSLLVLFAIIIFVIGFTQTQFFKDRLRTIIVSNLSTQLNGSLYLGRIRGNFFTGFSVDSIAILRGSDIVFAANSASVEYDPFLFTKNQLYIKHLIIDGPSARFVRSMKGGWNFVELIKVADTSSRGTFDWTITLDDLQIKRGRVSLVDSLSLASPQHEAVGDSAIEYHRFDVDDVSLSLNAKITRELVRTTIHHLSFSLRHPAFQLSVFKGELTVEPTGVSAKNVVIQTSRSHMELDADMRRLNLFRPVELPGMGYDSAMLRFRSSNLDLYELAQFIPRLNFLTGSASVECDAQGEFGTLELKRFRFQSGQSRLNITGLISNLHQPEKVTLNIVVGDTKIFGKDVPALMPALHLPEFNRLGMTTMTAEFNGKPLDFKIRSVLSGKFGEVKIDGAMDFTHGPSKYAGTVTTRQLNIADILDNDRLQSSLFSAATIQGKGFSLDSLIADMTLTIDSSVVQKIPIRAGRVQVRAVPHRIELVSSFGAEQMSATITGHGDFSDKLHPSYNAEIDLSSFNLSKLLNDSLYESNLTLHTSFAGSGRTIDDLSGNLKLSLQQSMYRGRDLSPLDLNFSLDQHDSSSKRLSMQSSLADIDFTGKFDLDVAVAAIANLSTNLIHTIEQHASPPDSTKQLPAMPTIRISPHTVSQREMNFRYVFKVYDLEPLSAFLGGQLFNAHGTLKGSISGSDDRLTVAADGVIDEFFSGTITNGVFLNDTKVSISANNLSPYQTLESLSAKLNLTIGSGLINGRKLSTIHTTIEYGQLKGKFTFTGLVDSVYRVSLGGQSSIQPNTYVFDLDSLTVNAGGEEWTNEQDIQTRLNYEGFRVMHAAVKHQNESLSFTGAMKHNGDVDFTGKLHNYDLAGLNSWLRNPELAQRDQNLGGILDADIQLSGSRDAPTIALTVIGQNMSVKQTHIGNAVGRINYADKTATVDISIKKSSTDVNPTFTIKGRVPVDLAFKRVERRFPDAEQQISIVSDGFDLSIVDPVIPDLDNLTGKLRCDISIAGTPSDPQYSGSISLTDVQCIFEPNNIPYIINGEFEPAGNTITIRNLTVKNPASEQWQSDAHFSGSLTIKDFQVESFDITAFGQLLLMTKETRKTIPTFYGLLFTEIDPEGLTLRGTLDQPYLSGNLSIRNADLELPPRSSSERGKGQTLNYVLVDDTSRIRPDSATFSSKFYHAVDSTAQPAQQRARKTKPSFVDRLRYNLTIDTKGTTAIKIIFTQATNEELYAELDGKVSAINDRGVASVYGDITVLPRSYYNFFKRFDATGSLRFVGPWDNPVLGIDAAYEGYSQYEAQSGVNETEQKSDQQKVIVKLKITGTRYEPKLAMDMQIQRDPGRDPENYTVYYRGGDVQSDAISFILTGKFRDQLSSRERENIAANFGSVGVSGLTSNLLSSLLTDFLRREFSFIRSAELSYGGGTGQESANLRLSGEAFNGYFRFGGKIFNDINNANVSYQLSLGRMLNVQSIRNLFIELERRVEGSDLTEDRKLTNNARLYYRFSF